MRQPRLVSIGYEGRTVDALIACLHEQAIDVLVDVRLNAISRKPGLSKRRLAAALEAAGIRYLHLRELGNPKENRDGIRAGNRRARNQFWGILHDGAGSEALRHVTGLLHGQVVALLCYEREHKQCHRALVAEALVQETPHLSVIRL
jgi:uncharacterized protein (DUF488 family)